MIYDRNGKPTNIGKLKLGSIMENPVSFGLMGNKNGHPQQLPLIRLKNFGYRCKSYFLESIFLNTPIHKNKRKGYLYEAVKVGNGFHGNTELSTKNVKRSDIKKIIGLFNKGLSKRIYNYNPVKIYEEYENTCRIYILKLPLSVYCKPFLADTLNLLIRCTIKASSRGDSISGDLSRDQIYNRLKEYGQINRTKFNNLLKGEFNYYELEDIREVGDKHMNAHSRGHSYNTLPRYTGEKKWNAGAGKKVEYIKPFKIGERVKIVDKGIISGTRHVHNVKGKIAKDPQRFVSDNDENYNFVRPDDPVNNKLVRINKGVIDMPLSKRELKRI